MCFRNGPLAWVLAGGLTSLPCGPLHRLPEHRNAESGYPQSKWCKGEWAAGSGGAFQDVVFKMVAPSLLLYSVPYNWVPKSSSCSRGGKFISSDWRERVKKICRLWKIDTVSLLFLTIYVLLMCKRYSLPPKASTVSFHQSISSNSWILSK